MDRFELDVPLHHQMFAVAPKNTRRKEDGWTILPLSHKPGDATIDHLVFALKNEGVQLLTLKRLFDRIDQTEIEKAARDKPTSSYIRRICFFFEWLIGETLDLPDVTGGAYVDAVDVTQQYGTYLRGNIKRFRIRDNLPGTPDFCPLVNRTHKLDDYIKADLSKRAAEVVAGAPPELIARAAAFLLLSDSKASFAIEGESPPKDRIVRWGSILEKAGSLRLSVDELTRLQREVIGDDRFVTLGLRTEGGFIGRHDAFGQPEPEHISARHEDLAALTEALCSFDFYALILEYHPVLAAASVAFGFVYIHPFEDGNGRIHRFLMHHVLAERGFTPKEIIFPISSAILDDIVRYKDVLESVSRPLLEWIRWKPTERGNVEVLNETIDYYRYFDATLHAEYIFKCIERTIEKDLPEELTFLGSRDEFHAAVTLLVDMGERRLDLLLRFLRQNGGALSNRARSNEFAKLTDAEVEAIEEIYARLFR